MKFQLRSEMDIELTVTLLALIVMIAGTWIAA